jgi:DNA-binding CsgD family transcriptional regulator
VLRLVAKGLTNAQIAQALTVTPHTINALCWLLGTSVLK